MTDELTDREAYERAAGHRQIAQAKRAQGQMLIAEAARHDRWAQKWVDWADDDYGEVPYPLGTDDWRA